MSEYNKLSDNGHSNGGGGGFSSSQQQDDDDSSLQQRSNNPLIPSTMSSASSISSKLSRKSRKVSGGELGVPLTLGDDNSNYDIDGGSGSIVGDEDAYSRVSRFSIGSSQYDTDEVGSFVGGGIMSSPPSSSPTSTSFPPASSFSPTTTQSYIAEDDPFYMFRGDLVKKLLLVEGELDRYLTVVRTTVGCCGFWGVLFVVIVMLYHSVLRSLMT